MRYAKIVHVEVRYANIRYELSVHVEVRYADMLLGLMTKHVCA